MLWWIITLNSSYVICFRFCCVIHYRRVIKNHLALPLKTTVCWELLTIMLLGIFFKFPVTMHNFEQSAGNQRMLTCILVGSSETISSPKIKIIFEDIVRGIKCLFIYLTYYNLCFTSTHLYSTLTNNS